VQSRHPDGGSIVRKNGFHRRRQFWRLIAFCWVVLLLPLRGYPQTRTGSVEIENFTWVQAEEAIKKYTVVLIALGARTKEHGPHLPLKTDYIMAEYLKDRVEADVPVAVLPTIQYGYYPSFLEYPGSVSIQARTFKETIKDICQSMNGYGVRKFYVLNTGISTLRPLEEAAEELKSSGVILRYLNLADVDKTLPSGLLKQEGGSHADEAETSMMLYIAPEIVDMSKAVKDYDSRPGRKGLTRNPQGPGTYSPTGIWGDPTLATREKGRIIVEATVRTVIRQVQELIDLKLN
jgi:creatinine amidohydrolase